MLHQDEGGIGKSIPETREISRGRSPREILRVEGNLEGGGDGFPNTSRVLVEYGQSLSIREWIGKSFPAHRGGFHDPLPVEKLNMIECTPPSRLQRLSLQEISWASGMDFPIPPSFCWSTDTILISIVDFWRMQCYGMDVALSS